MPSPSTSIASVVVAVLLVTGSLPGHDADVTVHGLQAFDPPGSQMSFFGAVDGQYSSFAALPVPSAAWTGFGQSFSCEPDPEVFR